MAMTLVLVKNDNSVTRDPVARPWFWLCLIKKMPPLAAVCPLEYEIGVF